MKEDDFRQARLNQFAGRVHDWIARYCVGRDLDRDTVATIKAYIDEMRTVARMREGLDFPAMHVVAFPRFGAVEIVRQDLDERALETWIVNLTVKHPAITPAEIAGALKVAFPSYAINAEARRKGRANGG